jgi:serine/threonine protein kinase
MDYRVRWQVIDELGQGGQGKVYRVLDNSKFEIDNRILPEISELINALTREKDAPSIGMHFDRLRRVLSTLNEMEKAKNHGALKLLHSPEDARDYGLSFERIKREIRAMNDVKHPNLLRILDYGVAFDYDRFIVDLGKDEKLGPKPPWFVSEFYPKGTLNKNKERFTGDFVGSLRAFRPLVEGVSELHKRGLVHRDIKPENIFLDSNGNLILGDFGLVFFTDERHTRISSSFENVGSRGWMPPWAMSMRIEDVKPTFDVFCLGKVLWFMIANKPILRLWYYLKDEFNVERIYRDSLYMLDSTAFIQEIESRQKS